MLGPSRPILQQGLPAFGLLPKRGGREAQQRQEEGIGHGEGQSCRPWQTASGCLEGIYKRLYINIIKQYQTSKV